MGLMKDLQGLGAAYASMHQANESYTLTAADKRGNTVAWQNRKKKNVKTGKPLYKYADHLQKEEESRLWNEVAALLTELHDIDLNGTQWKVVPLNELKKSTLGSYIAKGSKDLADRRFDQGDSEKRKYEPDEADDKEDKKLDKREQGIARAAKKLAKEETIKEKESYKTVAAVIDYDRSKKGSKDADWDSLHGKKKAAKKERDYAAWEREKMKKDDPNWKHKKYHTGMHGEDKDWGYDEKGNSLNPVDIEKRKKKDDDLAGSPNKIKEALAASGKFSVEEIANLAGIDIDEAQTAYEKARKAAARRAADRNAARRRGEMGGRMERETYTNEAGKEMHYKGYSA